VKRLLEAEPVQARSVKVLFSEVRRRSPTGLMKVGMVGVLRCPVTRLLYIVLIIDNQQQMLRFITYLKGTGTVTVPEICLFG